MALGRRHSDKQILDAFKRSREYNSYMTGAKYNPSNPYLYSSKEMEGAKRWYNAGGRAALLHGEERRQSQVERGLNQRGYALPVIRKSLEGGYKTVPGYSKTYIRGGAPLRVPSGSGSTNLVDRPIAEQAARRSVPRGIASRYAKPSYPASTGGAHIPGGGDMSRVPYNYRAKVMYQKGIQIPYSNIAANALGTMAGMGADYILMKSIENGNNLMDHIITNGHNADRVYTDSGKVADTFGDQNYPQSQRNYMVTGKDGKRYFKWKEALKNGDIYMSPEGNIMYNEGNPRLMKDGGGVGALIGMGNKVPRNYLTQSMIDQIPEKERWRIPGYRPQPGTPLRDGGELPGVVITGGGRQKPKPRPQPRPVVQPQKTRLETVPNPGIPNISPGFNSGLPHTMEGHVAPDYIQGPGGEVNRPRFDLGMINSDRSGVNPDEEFFYNEPHQSMRYDRRRPGYYGGRY